MGCDASVGPVKTDAIPLTGPALVLSPHFDDAALSCAAWITRPEALDVVTVFGGAPKKAMHTEWDALCGYRDSDDALTVRRAEESKAFSGTSHAVTRLDLVDGQYAPGPRSADERAAVRASIEEWATRCRDHGTLLAPAGAGKVLRSLETVVGPPQGARRDRIKKLVGPLGRRVLKRVHTAVAQPSVPMANDDHRFVRDIAVEAWRAHPQLDLWLYEEVPYLWGQPADAEVAAVARAAGARPALHAHSVDRATKAGIVAAYASQLTHLYAPQGRLDSPDGLPPVERYWRLDSVAGERP